MKIKSLLIVSCVIVPLSMVSFIPLSTAATSTDSPTYKNPFVPALPAKEIPRPDIDEVAPQANQPGIDQEAILPPPVVISGLIWNTNLPQAIVNEQVVKIGDNIGELTITNISKSGIDVLYRGQVFSIAQSDQNSKQYNVNSNIQTGDYRQ